MAAFRFYITRMHFLPLNPDKKQKEWETIQSIAKNNNFPQHLLQKLNQHIQNKSNHPHNEKKQKNLDHIHLSQPQNKKNYKFV